MVLLIVWQIKNLFFLELFFPVFSSFNLFLQCKWGRKRGRETSICGCLSWPPPTGDLAHNPGICPDWEVNRRPFGSQAGIQSTEPHQPGLFLPLFSSTHTLHAFYLKLVLSFRFLRSWLVPGFTPLPIICYP